MKMFKVWFLLMLFTFVLSVGHTFATATPPVDLTGTASDLVDYVGAAALAGASVFAAIYGVRILIKGFKAIAK